MLLKSEEENDFPLMVAI